MTFFANWIVIIFEFGGIGLTIYLLVRIAQAKNSKATINLKRLRNALCLLFPFIILATMSVTDLLVQTFGGKTYPSGLVFTVNLMMGLCFVGFLVMLGRSIDFSDGR